MQVLISYIEKQGYKEELGIRIRKIIRKENSFLLGMTEVITLNFDYIFRYLYAMAYLLMIACVYTDQLSIENGFSFLGAVLIVCIIFFVSLGITLISYRMKASNLNMSKAAFFYLSCKFWKSKQILENYD
jgi:hypothetical protein